MLRLWKALKIIFWAVMCLLFWFLAVNAVTTEWAVITFAMSCLMFFTIMWEVCGE